MAGPALATTAATKLASHRARAFPTPDAEERGVYGVPSMLLLLLLLLLFAELILLLLLEVLLQSRRLLRLIASPGSA
jgi:hypothetical protein